MREKKNPLLKIERKVIGVRTKGQRVQKKGGKQFFSFHSSNDECSLIKFCYNKQYTKSGSGAYYKGKLVRNKKKREKVKKNGNKTY